MSPFSHVTVEHPNPDRANIRDLKDWFVAMFQLDGNLYSAKVQCLYVREITPVIYALRDADRTYKWRKWVEWCRRCNVPLTILVQPCPKEVIGETNSLGPKFYSESVFEFPVESRSDFTTKNPLRRYDNCKED